MKKKKYINNAMTLTCLGSSSKGNCYILTSRSGESLILEAGISLNTVKKVLNFDMTGVVGVLCTHRHGDHAKYLAEFNNAGIKVFSSDDVKNSLPENSRYMLKEIKAFSCISIGSYRIFVLPMHHDVPCFGFVIEHADMGKILFATDTYKITHRVEGINYYLIETNYCDSMLEENIINGTLPLFMRDRIMKSHMEVTKSVEYLKKCNLKPCKGVYLIHLSENNSDASKFVNTAEKALGIPCQVLSANMQISL